MLPLLLRTDNKHTPHCQAMLHTVLSSARLVSSPSRTLGFRTGLSLSDPLPQPALFQFQQRLTILINQWPERLAWIKIQNFTCFPARKLLFPVYPVTTKNRSTSDRP